MVDGDVERSAAVVEVVAQAWARVDDGAIDAACAALEAAVLDAQRRADPIAEALLVRGLADLTRSCGRLDDAARHFERAAEALRGLDAPVPAVDATLCAADVRRALKQQERAATGYAAAETQFAALDDQFGVAHCQFHLAELRVATDTRAAEALFMRAAELYAETAKRERPRALRLANPHLPDAIPDPRVADAWIMSKLAEREILRLNPAAVVPSAREDGATLKRQLEPEDAPSVAPPGMSAEPPPAPHRRPDLLSAAILLLGVASTGCGLLLLAVPWTGRPLSLGVLIAALAAAVAGVASRPFGVRAVRLRQGVPTLAAAIVVACGVWIDGREQVEALAAQQLAAAEPAPPPPSAVPLSPIEAARADFERQVAQLTAQGDTRGAADVLHRYADFEAAKLERRRSVALLARSYDLYRSAGALAPAAATALQLGDALLRTQRPEPARQRFDAASGLYGEIQDPAGQQRSLRRRGDAERHLQRWSDAHASYAQALELVRQLRDADGEIALLLRLGATEQALGRPQQARPLFEAALKLSDRSGTPIQARVWLAIADFEAARGNDAPALRAYENAVTLAGASQDGALEARGLRRRGDYERRRGRIHQAQTQYELSARAARKREAVTAEALSRLNAARLALQLRDAAAARTEYGSAQALFTQQQHSLGAPRVALGLGDLETTLGDTSAAEARYTEALLLAVDADHVGLQIAALERLAPLLMRRDAAAADSYRQQAAELRREAFGTPAAAA
jgi:tetratricopeptide (TPR) repeat protein